MRHLFLLRHAKSSWSDPALADFDRPLNERGRRAARRMEAHLQAAGMAPDLVLCSAARRTRETLAEIETALAGAEIRFDQALYAAAPDRLLTALRAVEARFSAVMVIGHNPGLAFLADLLAGGAGETGALARMAEKFPTCALAVLKSGIAAWDTLGPGACRLAAFVRPADLED